MITMEHIRNSIFHILWVNLAAIRENMITDKAAAIVKKPSKTSSGGYFLLVPIIKRVRTEYIQKETDINIQENAILDCRLLPKRIFWNRKK